MRKMKKINGYLVVRFNDREKRDYPQLGNFGVIDAETYTGNIDIDRGVLEYDDAETIEIAVELARGLDAEEDYSEEPATYTLVVEDGDHTTETEIAPQLLIKGWETQLGTQMVEPAAFQDPERWAEFIVNLGVGRATAVTDISQIYNEIQIVKEGSSKLAGLVIPSKPSYSTVRIGGAMTCVVKVPLPELPDHFDLQDTIRAGGQTGVHVVIPLSEQK